LNETYQAQANDHNNVVNQIKQKFMQQISELKLEEEKRHHELREKTLIE